MATLNEILGGDTTLAGLLGAEAQAQAEQRAQNAALLNFGLNALMRSQGQPGQPRQGIGQILAASGIPAVSAYQQSFDKTLQDLVRGIQVRSAISELGAPKYMTIKTPGGGEQIIQIPKGTGAPSVVPIPGLDMSKPIEFDAPTEAYINLKYGKPFNSLTQEQKVDILKFNNAPNDEKLTTLKVEAGKFKFESGKEVPTPRGRSEFLITPTETAPPVPAPTSSVTPSPAEVKPTSAQVSVDDASKLRVPMTLVSKTMTDKDVPLISDSRITPKQQSQLAEARPQTQSSVEYVVNTNRAMRNLVSELLASPGLDDAFGLGGETLSKIPGSPAADARAKLERLGGNLFIEAMTALRNASKTGAGVGNATEKEGAKLEGSRANLQQFQSAKAARTELTRLLKSLEEAEVNVVNAYERTYGKGTFQFSPVETPEAKGKRPPLQNIFPGVQQ